MVLFGQKKKKLTEIKKTVKGSCKMKSQFMNILYNLVKIVVDEGKLLKHFSLFYSIFCYSSLRSVTQCIEPIRLTTSQNLLNGNAISLILSVFIICRFILCSIIVSSNLINHLCHTAFSWFDASLVSPIHFEHLKERDHV